jgi:RNA polymerase sigma-70 factor (ECF subfamily)
MKKKQIDLDKLAQDLRAGSQSAKALLYTHYKDYFYYLAYKYVKNEEDAHDIVSDSFIKIFKYAGQLRDNTYLITWCGRVVTTLSINHLRVRRYEKDVYTINPGLNIDTHSHMDLEMVKKCIENLAPGYRRVVEMHCLEGLSGAEIAEKLNINPVTVRSQIFKARKLLKKAMKYEY